MLYLPAPLLLRQRYRGGSKLRILSTALFAVSSAYYVVENISVLIQGTTFIASRLSASSGIPEVI